MNIRSLPGFATAPTRFLFFTGKGGVGKTSLSTATAIALADSGKRVLLVSTDAASNLDEMLGVPLSNRPVTVPGVAGLQMLNIDPDTAAESYRQRVLAQLDAGASDDERNTVREQLSGACTTEIAAFDEFAALLAGEGIDGGFDHVVFDTAPTGHTLRLLSLPKAWTGFLAGNDRGASCLGPHSGLKMQEARFNAALRALSDPALTTVVLVTRPDPRPMQEAARTADELRQLGLGNQRLAVNGVFHAVSASDPIANAIERLGREALDTMPDALARLPRDEVPLRAFDTVGLPALRALLQGGEVTAPEPATARPALAAEPLSRMADELAAVGHGLIMVMGKGGVGKTTIAAALAVGLVQRGHSVHLTTTDPAAHVAEALNGSLEGLKVGRIDPKAETAAYIAKIMATRGKALDEQGKALLLEDLQSPCTEEVAVFHAFSRVVNEARSAFVVLDTAPTGHSLLLMDATGAYHRQMTQQYEGQAESKGLHIITPLMRLQDASMTRVIIVTLPEVTPVSQAAALQDDLRRAKIEPWAWVINKSIAATGTTDPLLQARLAGEIRQTERIAGGLAKRTFVLPWLPQAPVGVAALGALVRPDSTGVGPEGCSDGQYLRPSGVSQGSVLLGCGRRSTARPRTPAHRRPWTLQAHDPPASPARSPSDGIGPMSLIHHGFAHAQPAGRTPARKPAVQATAVQQHHFQPVDLGMLEQLGREQLHDAAEHDKRQGDQARHADGGEQAGFRQQLAPSQLAAEAGQQPVDHAHRRERRDQHQRGDRGEVARLAGVDQAFVQVVHVEQERQHREEGADAQHPEGFHRHRRNGLAGRYAGLAAQQHPARKVPDVAGEVFAHLRDRDDLQPLAVGQPHALVAQQQLPHQRDQRHAGQAAQHRQCDDDGR